MFYSNHQFDLLLRWYRSEFLLTELEKRRPVVKKSKINKYTQEIDEIEENWNWKNNKETRLLQGHDFKRSFSSGIDSSVKWKEGPRLAKNFRHHYVWAEIEDRDKRHVCVGLKI